MTLTESEFDALLGYAVPGLSGLRGDAVCGEVSSQMSTSLRERGLVVDDHLSAVGKAALEPYRVDSAVILAAGSGTRMVPLSYERPKAMLEVRGEVLIERLIGQLHEAGISEIAVVVGYRKEEFFYLEDDFGVDLVIVDDYLNRKNHASLYAARGYMKNSYVCLSDQYFSHNLFSPYCFKPYCSVVRSYDGVRRRAAGIDGDGRIVDARHRDAARCYLLGPAYLDRALSKRLIATIATTYDDLSTAGKSWSDIYLEHADELSMTARILDADEVRDFDYLHDLCDFDNGFIDNVDSSILDNICTVLSCERGSIRVIEPISQGLTNLSFLFSCGGEQRYVYRYPGAGTDAIINRRSEAYSQRVARKLSLDTTFVYEDPERGWKISRFIPDCTPFDYNDSHHVAEALRLLRKLHGCGEVSPWAFDFHDETVKLVGLLEAASYPLPSEFPLLCKRMNLLARHMSRDQVQPCLCHNDFYGPNLLVKDGGMDIIDWEYSAMGDYAGDIGNFISQGSGYTVDEAVGCLDYYFGRPATSDEVRHCLAMTAIVGFYWYVWAIYKESQGNPVGEWIYIWYKAAKEFGGRSLALYGV